MKTKLLTIATMAVLMLTATTKGQAQTPCLPQMHGLTEHQSALCGITQTIQLAEGWNWVSLSIEVEDPIVTLQMLEDALIDNGMHIESDGLGTEYLGDGLWLGDLEYEGLTNEQMFLIEVSTDCSVALQGTPVNPANHEITINPGWNWIGFPCAQELSINDAMAGFEAEFEDLIESKDNEAAYFGEWMGFETLQPGQGYMYFSNSNDTKTLTFQTGAKARRAYPNFGKIKTQPIEVIPIEGE